MEKFRKRPKGDYIQQADWQELYTLTQYCKSELLFYKDELRFFRRLIDNFFGWMTHRDNIDAVRELEMDLLETDKRGQDLLLKVNKHLQQLAQMVVDPKRKDASIFRIEHEHLEDEIVHFENTFRSLRKDVFAVTEHVMESERMAPLNLKSKPISA